MTTTVRKPVLRAAMHASLGLLCAFALVAGCAALPWISNTIPWQDGSVSSDGWISMQTPWIVETPFWFCAPLDGIDWLTSPDENLVAEVSCVWSDERALHPGSQYDYGTRSGHETDAAVQGCASFTQETNYANYSFDTGAGKIYVVYDSDLPARFRAVVRVPYMFIDASDLFSFCFALKHADHLAHAVCDLQTLQVTYGNPPSETATADPTATTVTKTSESTTATATETSTVSESTTTTGKEVYQDDEVSWSL